MKKAGVRMKAGPVVPYRAWRDVAGKRQESSRYFFFLRTRKSSMLSSAKAARSCATSSSQGSGARGSFGFSTRHWCANSPMAWQKKIKPLARQRGDENSLRPAVGMTHDFRLKHGVVDLVVNEYRRNVVCLDVLEHRVHLADLVLAHG